MADQVKVRTKRRHDNRHGDRYEKFPAKVYELPAAEAVALEAAGYAEPYVPPRAGETSDD